VYLDPHTTQVFEEQGARDESFHCQHASRMKILDLDPSIALVGILVFSLTYQRIGASVAEWLRLLTSNHLSLTAVGSNPDRYLDSFM
jgi:hypothetical protein